MQRRGARKLKVKGAEIVEAGPQTLALESEGERVSCVISLLDFIVAASGDGNIRVYDLNTSGAARAVFRGHKKRIGCLAFLEDDLILSVSEDGQIFVWRPSNCESIGSLMVDDVKMSLALAKLDEKRVIVGTGNGDLAILSHSAGANVKLEEILRRKHVSVIRRFIVSNDLLVSCSHDGNVKVWNKDTLNPLGALEFKGNVNDIAVNDKYLVFVCKLGRIYVYHNVPPYARHSVLQERRPYAIFQSGDSSLNSVVALNSDIVAMAGSPGYLSFVSLSNKSLIARVKLSKYILTSLAILSDSRIAVVDCNGLCTLLYPPYQVQDAVRDYVDNMRNMIVANAEITHPIRDAWDSVQVQPRTLRHACETVIKSENTKRSLEEWCMAHGLLMRAVNTGVVPRSRHYNGTELHWHTELYRHCDSLAIGEKEVDFLVSLFLEAERAGVIAKGTSESFVYAVGIREDMEKDKWYSANAIYQLFLRQAETDARLKQVIHYQNLQQLGLMAHSVLGLSLAVNTGLIAATAVSGGPRIKNSLQASGFVESLLGARKRLSGGLGNRNLVDQFLRRGNEVLSEDHWNRWGKEHRQAFQDVARNMGFTVEELRTGLMRAAEMMNGQQANCGEASRTEIVEIVQENETSTTEAQNIPAVVVTNLEVSQPDVNVQEAYEELKRWAKKSLNKATIGKLKCKETASCLAAFLLNYDEFHISSFIRLKNVFQDVFSTQFIDGLLFVYAEGDEREELKQAVMSAISKVVDDAGSRNLGVKFKRFLDQVLES